MQAEKEQSPEQAEVVYFVLSLYHTKKSDDWITLWKPCNAGYCYTLELAGQYDAPERGYHDSDDNMPVEVDVIKGLAVPFNDDRYIGKIRLPNTLKVRKALGLRIKNGTLARKPTTPNP